MQTRQMRRSERAIQMPEIEDILNNGVYGILSTVGEENQPYGVPINYVYGEGKLWIHCAKEGYKLENIQRNQKVSFCVVGKAEIVPSEFSTDYSSVIILGNAQFENGLKKEQALRLFINKYSHQNTQKGEEFIQQVKDHVQVISVSVEHISGKARNK